MVEIVDGALVRDALTKNARGGTELMANRLLSVVEPSLLENVQIIFSRPNKLLDGYKKVLYIHDLPEDPAIAQFADRKFREQFDLIVFVSYYQYDRFRRYFKIPMTENMIVIKNAIDPIPLAEKPSDKLRFIYHTTPHRGLEILYPVYDQISKDFPGLTELKVFSSFDIYGWATRDDAYSDLIKALQDHKDVTYSKSVPNEQIRTELQKSHAFLFPSIWEETSCLALIEAMSANVVCVHTSYGALPETSFGMNVMLPYMDDINAQANVFYGTVHTMIRTGLATTMLGKEQALDSKYVVDKCHNLDVFKLNWELQLRAIQENGNQEKPQDTKENS